MSDRIDWEMVTAALVHERNKAQDAFVQAVNQGSIDLIRTPTDAIREMESIIKRLQNARKRWEDVAAQANLADKFRRAESDAMGGM